jgi:hypothetical protein
MRCRDRPSLSDLTNGIGVNVGESKDSRSRGTDLAENRDNKSRTLARPIGDERPLELTETRTLGVYRLVPKPGK